jgi:hypothetical protein
MSLDATVEGCCDVFFGVISAPKILALFNAAVKTKPNCWLMMVVSGKKC